jgi:hypothetical protein
MNRKKAGFIFLGICFVNAVLLLTGSINLLDGGIIFAVSLVLFGGISGGFRKN